MKDGSFTTRPGGSSGSTWLQRKGPLRVGEPDDAFEREADQVAAAVTAGKGMGGAGVSLTGIPVGRVQRDGGEAPKSDEDKLKEGAEKLGEAFLETEVGKKLKEEALKLPPVKAVTDFADTLHGKVILGSAAAGAVAALAATGSELPAQIPEIPLDKITPGLKVKITYEGPVNKPTKAMLTFSYTEQVKKADKPKQTRAEKQREENARVAAEQQKFRDSLTYPPGSKEAKDKAAEEEATRKAIFGGIGKLPDYSAQKFPGLANQPESYQLQLPGIWRPKPISLLEGKLELKSLDEIKPGETEKKKKDEGGAVQRKTRGHGSAGGAAPGRVDEVLSAAGRPLDASLRSLMEARFGRDFSHVRVHDDAGAQRSAGNLDALAYTAGEHIVFAAGQYSPNTAEGQRLIAHELTHVVQQTRPGAGGGVIRRKDTPKPGTAPVKFYQEVIDDIAYADRRMDEQRRESPFLVIEHLNYRGLKALLTLCVAVENESVTEIPLLLDTFIGKDIGFHLGTITRDLMLELAVRMMKLGLESDSKKLREHFSKQSSFHGQDAGAARRNVDFFKNLVAFARANADLSTPDKAVASLEFMVRVFLPVRDAIAAIDRERLADERRWGSGMVLRPHMTTREYYDAHYDLLELLLGGMESVLQHLTDTAASELSGGKGSTTLARLDGVLRQKLEPAFFPTDEKKNIAGISFRITRTQLGKGGRGTIDDAFATGAEAKKRKLPITTYDPEQQYVRELHKTIAGLYDARLEQVQLLARLYGDTALIRGDKGDDKVKVDKVKAGAALNAETIAKLEGGLKLHSDADWRAFLLQRYEDMVAGAGTNPTLTPAEALSALVTLLFQYLQAFTVHARFTNVYDIGDSYLNRDFPRALSGQLIHDCGVYALRVAYILSLVRDRLKLRFRFVILPVHVALVIDGDGMPTFIVNNNHFEEISAAAWQSLHDDWKKFTETKTVTDASGATTEVKQAPAGPRDEQQFVGEVASASFISGPLDTPFIVSDVPAAADQAEAAKRRLWAFYQTTATRPVFGPAAQRKGGDAYLFHQRFLGLTEDHRDLHNELVVPFWNEAAPAVWNAFIKGLKGADGKRTTITAGELADLLDTQNDAYVEALKGIDARDSSLDDKKRRISQQMRGDAQLRAAGARLGYGPRAATLWHYHWNGYRGRLQRFLADVTARPADEELTVADIETKLDPPFIPTEDKRMHPFD